MFILNPRSFWHKWKMDSILARIHEYFFLEGDENYSTDYTIEISQFPRDAVGIIRAFAKSLPKGTPFRVYAVGGDGILFDCLNGVMGIKNADLAAIPFGRTNNFVQGFKRKNKSLFRRPGRLVKAPAFPMDVIRGGNNYALNYCTIGIESLAILNTLNIQEKMEAGGSMSQWLNRKLYKQLYYVGAAQAIYQDKRLLYQQYEVSLDGEDFSGAYRGIAIFNGAYYGGNKHPIPSAMPNDGFLDVLLVRSAGRLRTASLVPFYVQGWHDKFSDFTFRRARRITISSRQPIIAALDDVVFFDTSLTIELLPSAVCFADPTMKGYLGVSANE